MTTRRSTRVLLALALALGIASPGRPQAPGPIALTHANVIDGASPTVQRTVTILVRGRTIERIGAGLAVPNGYREIDVGGRYVVPGLIDAHTHLASLESARRALESGVTTVRSASTPHYEDVAIRELVKSGVLAGPDVIASGVFVRPQLGETILADPRLGAWAGGVQSLEALRGVVRVNLDHGVDVIKTMATERAGLPNTDPRKEVYNEDQLRAIVDEAKAKNVPVMVHAHGDDGAYAAVAAGARSIEHGTFLSDSTLRLMKQKGTYLVPTLSTVVDLTEPGGDYDDPVLAIRGQHMLPRLKDAIRRAHALGVPIVTGGDTGYGPESLTRISHEVMRFVELGFAPFEALQSATTTAAALLGVSDRTGKLVAGYEADLIVVEGNPLENVMALQDVLVVVSNGQVALNRLPFTRPR